MAKSARFIAAQGQTVSAWGSSHELNIKPKFFSQVYISNTHVLCTGASILDYF